MIQIKENLKNNSKLICVTGFMGVGKSTSINYFKKHNFEIFIMDQYIHDIYKFNKIGYKIIKENFGSEYVNNIEVDRKKLRELILNNEIEKKKLDSLMLEVMKNKINELYLLNKIIFVELGIYIYNQDIFYDLFNKILAITSSQSKNNDNFSKFHSGYKFSTKYVDNYEKLTNSNTVYCDYIVENNDDLTHLENELKKFLKTFL